MNARKTKMAGVPLFGAPYAPSETNLPQNELPARVGPYGVIGLLATGSTSDVLLAREEAPHGFERLVALKVLLPQFRDDENYARRFAREASAFARLPHPAVGRLHQLLDAGDGELVLVLEYVDGLPLNKLRAELHRLGDRLSDEASIFIAYRLFSALSAAHSARDPVSGEFSPVIHGDVNPSNLIVPWDGYAKLVDFGSARIAGVGGDGPENLASRSYAAPEQGRGRDVTMRADLYSASLILWELLTDRRVVVRPQDSNRESLRALAYPTLPSMALLRPDLPKAIHDIIARGLQPDPDRRDVFAEDVCEVLRGATDLGLARNGLAEGLAGLRFASIEDTRLATTPHLPAYELEDHSLPPPLRSSIPSPSDGPPWTPDPPPAGATKRTPWAWGGGTLLLALAVAGAVGLFVRHDHVAMSAGARVAPSAPAHSVAVAPPEPPATPPPSAPLPPPTASASVPVAAPAAVVIADSEAPSTYGTLTVPTARAGHRVWIDGRVVGQSPGTFTVRCGPHDVRVGSHGSVQRIDARCGEDLVIR